MQTIRVQTLNEELVIDSRLIAQELGITHKTLKENIRNYQKVFERFANLAVLSEGAIGTSSYETFYYLNEEQAYFALTLSRNTEQVVEAKAKLVEAFGRAKKALHSHNEFDLPRDYLSALKSLVAAEEEKQVLTLKAAEQEQQIMELQPKAQVYEQVMSSSNYFSMSEVAKSINLKNMGRNNLFKFLKMQGILQANNQPYQKYINAGYFKVIMKPTYIPGVCYPVTVVSPKGVEFIIGLLQKAGYQV